MTQYQRSNKHARGELSEGGLMLMAGALLATLVGWVVYREFKAKPQFFENIRTADHGTSIAYIDKNEKICVLRAEDLASPDKAKVLPTTGSIDAILWASHARGVCYLRNVGHIFDTKHQLVRHDISSGEEFTLVDLLAYKNLGLPDDDISELRLDGQRIYFKLGNGNWYSTREDDPGVRSERDGSGDLQKTCRCSLHEISEYSDQDTPETVRINDGEHAFNIVQGSKPVWSGR